MRKKQVFVYLPLLLVILFACSNANAQTPELIKTNHRFVSEGLQVTVDFNRDVSSLTKSSLKYQTTKSTGEQIVEKEVAFVKPLTNVQRLVFVIPNADLENSREVDYFAVLASQTKTIKVYPKNSADLTFYQEQLKTVQGKLIKAETDLRETEGKLVKAEGDLRETTTKLNAKQGELNQVLEGIRPTSIVFDKENLVTDDKIVISFITNKPTRIRATLNGANNSKQVFNSDNVATKHTVIFQGIQENSDNRIEAVALDLGTGEEIKAVSIDSTKEPRLLIRTKNRINPPTAAFNSTSLPNSIKIKVKPNQDVFAEVLYRQIGEDGQPAIKAQTVGTIKQDTFGNFSGDESFSNGAEREIEIPNLKENTQYEIEIKLVNNIGKQPTDSFRRIIRTAPKPVAFDFDKAVDIQLNPLGIKATWNSTIKADKATIQATYKDGTSINFAPDTVKINNTELTADITTSDALKLIQKNEVPILRFSMTNGQTTVVRDFKLSFVMPKNAEAKTSALTGTIKDALVEVTEGIEKKKKIDWSKLILGGLSLVVPFL